MTRRRAPYLAIAAAGILPCAALSACGNASSHPGGGSATSSRAASVTSSAPVPAITQLTTAELKSRLLTVSDLPGGYQPYQLTNNDPSSSDKPACLSTLNGLTFPPPSTTVTEASAAFAASQTGPWVLEVLRSYPGQGAAQAFGTAKTVLSGCHTFSIAWSSPQETATESVTPAAAPALGNQAWAATVDVQGSLPVAEELILVQAGSSLLALQVASAIGLPPASQVTGMATAAAAKLTRS